MAEVLGIVASGIAVAQLAGSIVTSAQNLHNIWTSLKGAPKVVGDCLREIELLGTIVRSIKFEGEGEDVVKSALVYCEEVVGEFESVLRGIALVDGMGRRGRQWGKAKFLFKEKELGSRSIHQRQVSMLTALMSSQKIVELEDETTVDDMDSSITLLSTTVRRARRASTNAKVVTKWYGLGWSQTTSFSNQRPNGQSGDYTTDDDVEIEWRFLPSAWLRLKGFAWNQSRSFGHWKYNFTSLCVRPDTSRIFQACKSGNLNDVIHLINAREATIFDISEDGFTLLHVAAAHLRSGLCRWLISQGAKGDAVDVWGRTALYIAAAENGGGSTSTFQGSASGFMTAIDNASRPADACDTFRVLIKEGQSDPMSKTYCSRTVLHKCKETVLHLHTGSVAAYKYLLQQEDFMIDLAETDYEGMNILSTHLWRSQSLVPHLTELALITLTFSQDIHSLATQESIYGLLPLHWAAAALRSSSFEDEQTKGFAHLTISTLLKAGADVHAISFRGRTPLSFLATRRHMWRVNNIPQPRKGRRKASRERLRKRISWRLFAWLDLLQEAGYDLKEYIRKEQNLDFNRRVYVKGREEFCEMNIQELPEEDAIILRFEDNDWLNEEPQQETEMRVPGAFPKSSGAFSDHASCVQEQSGDIRFFIGPLKDGVQELEILDWLGIYYWEGR